MIYSLLSDGIKPLLRDGVSAVASYYYFNLKRKRENEGCHCCNGHILIKKRLVRISR